MKIIKIVIYILIITVVFFLGAKWQKFQYEDVCLDMGGGINPGEHSICVIEK
jgi:hypothetical protein